MLRRRETWRPLSSISISIPTSTMSYLISTQATPTGIKIMCAPCAALIRRGNTCFFCHDAERAGLNAFNSSVNSNVSTKNTPRAPTAIHTDLRTNANSRDEYAIRFADRAYYHLFNEGALTPENGAAQWAARADGIREAMKAESARWGDAKREPALTLIDWDAALQREYTSWFPLRTPITLNQFRATGVYPDLDPPTFSQQGGSVPANFELLISSAVGNIYYTTDGSDPRQAGGAINPAATLLPGSLSESTLLTKRSTDWRYLDDGVDMAPLGGTRPSTIPVG